SANSTVPALPQRRLIAHWFAMSSYPSRAPIGEDACQINLICVSELTSAKDLEPMPKADIERLSQVPHVAVCDGGREQPYWSSQGACGNAPGTLL
ncbi:MAG: hypothetical protein ACRDOH_31750, partial [Streptosporangiaceae bacterium]